MKNINNILFAFIIALYLTSCHSHKDNTPQPAPANGALAFHLHSNVDDQEIEYDSILTMSDGRKILISSAQLYLSNIKLVKADGSIYNVPDTIILQTAEEESYLVANVPSGNYKSISFSVGFDATNNKKEPSVNKLLNHSEMWFGNSAQPDGYVFVNLKGKIDTTANRNGSENQMQSFAYKIGSNSNYKVVNMPDKAFSILPGETQYIHMVTDYNKLFNGVQLNNFNNLSDTTVASNGTGLGSTIANNIPSMFSFE